MGHIDQFTADLAALLRRVAEENVTREGREADSWPGIEPASRPCTKPDIRPGFDPIAELARSDRPAPVASPGRHNRTVTVALTEEDREAVAAAFRPMKPAFAYRASFIGGLPLNLPMRILATCHDWRPMAWLGPHGRPRRRSRRALSKKACAALAAWRPLAGIAEALRPLIDPRPRRPILVGPPTADVAQGKPAPMGWEVV
jgi:hypothetical protein